MSFLNNIQPNEPTANLDSYFIAMYGKAKFGKTTFAVNLAKKFYGNLDSALLLGCEIGYKALKGVHAIPITTFAKTTDDEKQLGQYGFVETVDELIENVGKTPYKLIIIDTVTALEGYAVEHIIKNANRKDRPQVKYTDISDIKWGKGHNAVEKEIYKQIDRLKKHNYGVFVITHEKTSKITNRDGFEYDYTSFNLSKKTADVISREADMIIYGDLQVEETKKGTQENRKLLFRSDGNILCGTRLNNFPSELPVSVDEFMKEFSNSILDMYDGNEEELENRMEREKEKKEEQLAIHQNIAKKQKSNDDFEEDDIEDDETDGDIEQATKIIGELDELMVDMKKSDKLKCGKHFKSILGTNNYREITDSALLKQALEFAESL